MKRSDQIQVDKALAMLSTNPAYVAKCLAVIHRCGTTKTQNEIEQLVQRLNLAQYLAYSNGCLIPLEV